MINAGKLQTVENIEDLAIYIKETKNKNLEKEDLIQVNAMLAVDVKWLKKKEVDDSKPGEVKTFYFIFLHFFNKYTNSPQIHADFFRLRVDVKLVLNLSFIVHPVELIGWGFIYQKHLHRASTF